MAEPYSPTSGGIWDRLKFWLYLGKLQHVPGGGGCNPPCPEQWIDPENKIVWLSRPLFKNESVKPEFKSYKIKIIMAQAAAPTNSDILQSLNSLGTDIAALRQGVSSVAQDVTETKKDVASAPASTAPSTNTILIAVAAAVAFFFLAKKL